MSQEFLTALVAYKKRIDAVPSEVTPDVFSEVFAEGVEVHSLTDQEVAERFSASRPTANRWRNGKSAPAPGYRKLIVGDLKTLTNKRIREVERSLARRARPAGGGGTATAIKMVAKSG